MKCTSCNGTLNTNSNVCPYCGTRVEIDLKEINFRDLGPNPGLPCPSCTTPLSVVETDSVPKVTIERCPDCYGTFFNPGEIELLLEQHTTDFVWTDLQQLKTLGAEKSNHADMIEYLRCPFCQERMSRLNFGGRSGIILDRCGTHGVWVQNGEFQQISEWWRAGGKLIYEQHEKERTALLFTSGHEKTSSSSPPPLPEGAFIQDSNSPSILGTIAKFFSL